MAESNDSEDNRPIVGVGPEDARPLLHQAPELLSASTRKVPISEPLAVKRDRMAASPYRMTILVWLTLQNSIHTLLIRYSRARVVQDMYLSSVAVFLTEVLKVIICLGMVIYDEGGLQRAVSQLRSQVLQQPSDTLKVCIPAMIYTAQNNLFYVAASHLDAATFMVTSQLKIFTTAIFSVVILQRSLSRVQWWALAVLFSGVSLVQLQTSSGGASAKVSGVQQSPTVGFGAVVIACCLSGFAGIYFEKILKSASLVSLWVRNVQMAVFALPASLLAAYAQDGRTINEKGLLYGFDFVVWLTVIWYGIGGLSVAVCIKYADNIAKNFATSVAIVLSTLGSVVLFGFQPSLLFLLGAALVICSIFLYSSSPAVVNFFRSLKKSICL